MIKLNIHKNQHETSNIQQHYDYLEQKQASNSKKMIELLVKCGTY